MSRRHLPFGEINSNLAFNELELQFSSWVTYNQGNCVGNNKFIHLSLAFTATNNGTSWTAIKLPYNPSKKQYIITQQQEIMEVSTDGWIKTVSALSNGVHTIDSIILI